MLGRILKYLFWGISWGCTFFVISNVLAALAFGEDALMRVVDDFVRQAIGAMFVGICCGTPSIFYTFERLALWKCVSIHFAVGLGGYFSVAYKLGWMPQKSWGYTAGYILFGILVFVGIWFCFYKYGKCEAKKVNARLRELEDARGA